MKKASIKDVANLAGVSPTTVSQVLNKRNDHFPQETIDKVLAAQKELGYVPNQSAKSLRGNANPLIGVLVPSLRNPFFSDLMQSMQEHAHGVADLAFFSATDDEIDQAILTLIGRGVNGLVIARMLPHVQDVNTYLNKQKLPYVVLDQTNDDSDADSVKTNEYQGGVTVAEHLLQLGHRDVALILPDYLTENLRERIQGFEDTVNQTANTSITRFETSMSKHGGLAIASRVKRANVTAAFALNDELAIGLLRGLKNAGVDVPKTFSVVGYDNTDYSEFMVPSVTTVTQPVWRMGQIALEMVLARINDPSIAKQTEILDTHLIIRESTDSIK
ncbi:MAG: ribose utilization transcriptional repressor RbsR [Weissella cibaria]